MDGPTVAKRAYEELCRKDALTIDVIPYALNAAAAPKVCIQTAQLAPFSTPACERQRVLQVLQAPDIQWSICPCFLSVCRCRSVRRGRDTESVVRCVVYCVKADHSLVVVPMN